jgi:hypothetical protein
MSSRISIELVGGIAVNLLGAMRSLAGLGAPPTSRYVVGFRRPGTLPDRLVKEDSMIFEWETEEERLLRFMKIPPKKKLEWLCQMHEFMVKCSSKRTKLIRWKLRKIH